MIVNFMTAIVASKGVARSVTPNATLAAVGRRAGIEVGAAVAAEMLAEPWLTGIVARECATVSPEVALKWAALAPGEGTYDFAPADTVAAFARRHGLRMRGHTLLWHQSIPEWTLPLLAGEDGWPLVERHIRTVMTRYRHRVDEWDVVNEPIADDGGLRDGPLLSAFGPAYIANGLRAAHAVSPNARLAINEYGVEYARPIDAARRAGLLALVRTLVAQRVPLHRVGIQAHLNLAHGPLALAELREFIGAVARLGLEVSITELDVRERDLILPVEARDRLVAEHVAAFLDCVLAEPVVRSLSCWGLSDRFSWLIVTDEDRARFPGAWAGGSTPGLNRGLPYDAAGQAKPMRAAIIDALARRVNRGRR